MKVHLIKFFPGISHINLQIPLLQSLKHHVFPYFKFDDEIVSCFASVPNIDAMMSFSFVAFLWQFLPLYYYCLVCSEHQSLLSAAGKRCCHRLQRLRNYVINHGALSGGVASAGSPGTTSLMDFDPISWLNTGPRHPKTRQLSFLLMSCCRRYPPWGRPEKVSLFVMPLDSPLVSKTKIICLEGNKIPSNWNISLASGDKSWELTCKTEWSTLECQVNVQAYASETVLL